jgi:O-antigen ligase
MLTAAVGLSILLFTYPHLNRWRKLVVPILLGAALVVAFNTIPQENFERIAETSSELSEGEVSNRMDIWRAGLELFRQYPLLGVGVGNYGTAVEPLLGYRKPSHNAFLAMLVDLGLVGLLLFTLILVVTFLPLFSLRAPHRTFYLVLSAALIVAMLPLNAENDRWLWILLALVTTRKAYVLALPSVVTDQDGALAALPAPMRVKHYGQ